MCTAKRVGNLPKKYHMLQFKRLLVFLVVTENPWRRHLILCNKSHSETFDPVDPTSFQNRSTDLGTLEVVLCDLQLSSPKKPWTRKSQHFLGCWSRWRTRQDLEREARMSIPHHFPSQGGVLLKACECSVVFHLWSKLQHLSKVKRYQRIVEKLGSNLPLETSQVR